MKTVVVISPDYIDNKMAGPGIRYWNFAKELSKDFNVVLFTPNDCQLTVVEFTIKTIAKKELIKEINAADTVILQGMTLWTYPFLKRLNKPIIIDLYDPFILENLETFISSDEAENLHKAALSILIDQLQHGDYFICASEKQKDFWIGMLAALNRLNPSEYNRSKDLSALIGVVPFGLDKDEPQYTQKVMKGVVDGIDADDKVLLWGGGLWPWLDPLTAIEAVHHLSKQYDHIKLFFMGTKHPNPTILNMEMVERAIELSDSLGLTGKYVFFNDWVPYDNRFNYYLEADIGLSLHFDHLETRFSFRTRMLDYIRCNLPVICTSGDVFSDIVSEYRIGSTVLPGDSFELARLIKAEIMRNKKDYDFHKLQEAYSWSRAIDPLRSFCRNPQRSEGKRYALKVQGTSKVVYYFSKIKHYTKDGKYKYIMKKVSEKFLKKT
ncbi:glycosyltransferase family 4 protein [Paenibacillus tarimensis]|uniref:glycosyltransferase family 4 protein n=1 Tax=Paenibacillus tarimensis TaxID=416012 RepID=UPI001F248D60|nr:glycosyltransferase family 4 protein [Paenibacillus tarimensis]MCF2945887.1 glycosyltransferase family 4 protein [Paenibacillus tarimensis]